MAKTPMMPNMNEGKAAVVRHMESLADLSSLDIAALHLSLAQSTRHQCGDVLIALDAPLDVPFFVLSGWIARVVSRPSGSRQIVDVYLAGDLGGYALSHDACAVADYECLTSAVTTSAAALVRDVHDGHGNHPALERALAALEREVELGLVNQVVRMGCMLANERVADFLGEIERRHDRVGCILADELAPPVNQATLGEVLGMSTVHVNRVLQQLRRERGGTRRDISGPGVARI